MKYNAKHTVFCYVVVALLPVTQLMYACNPFQQAEEAAEAVKTSDSLVKEFQKVNEQIKRTDSLYKAGNDAALRNNDSISDKEPMLKTTIGNKGVGAIH